MAGETRALARAIRMVEDRDPGIADLLREVRERAGRARVVGVTGPPGSGKSTLCDQVIERWRAAGTPGRRDRGGSLEPVHRWRDPRGPGPDGPSHARSRRVHPEHGRSRSSRRARGGCPRGDPSHRRLRPRSMPARDGRRRPVRARGHGDRRHDGRGHHAGRPGTPFRSSRPASSRSPTSSWSTRPTFPGPPRWSVTSRSWSATASSVPGGRHRCSPPSRRPARVSTIWWRRSTATATASPSRGAGAPADRSSPCRGRGDRGRARGGARAKCPA